MTELTASYWPADTSAPVMEMHAAFIHQLRPGSRWRRTNELRGAAVTVALGGHWDTKVHAAGPIAPQPPPGRCRTCPEIPARPNLVTTLQEARARAMPAIRHESAGQFNHPPHRSPSPWVR